MTNFKYLDSVFVSLGCQIFSSSRSVGIINIVFRVICVIDLLRHFTINAVTVTQSFDLYAIGYVVLNNTLIYHELHLICRKSRIQNLITNCHQRLNSENKRLVNCWITFTMVILAISVVLHVVSVIFFHVGIGSRELVKYYFLYQPDMSTEITVVEHVLAFISQANYVIFHANAFTMSTVLYTYLVLLLHAMDMSYFSRFSTKSMTLYSPSSLYKLRKELDALRLEFNSLFSLIPFLWFSYLFFSFSGFIVMTVTSTSVVALQWTSITAEWIMYSLFVSAVVIAVLYCESLSKKSQRQATEFALQLVMQSDDHLKASELVAKLQLISELNQHSLHLTGWSIFNLNRGLLLSFAGSLISFSVLFAGLMTTGATPTHSNNTSS